ncbi:hypothetical protein AA0Z99_00255 [Agrococcus sp. 1P02AA]|uniref:hypothetical protein n=1 Tax=Agrococcus sp. 1P02AA TaxID=3132259 RepID=UPI0039A62607
MLQLIEEWKTAADVYDGDVVRHPATGKTVTIATMFQLSPLLMHFVPGVVEFDPLDNKSANAILDDSVEELELEPGAPIFQLWKYAPGQSS